MSTTYTPTCTLAIGLSIAEVVAQALNSFTVSLKSGVGSMPALDHTFASGSGVGQINKVFWDTQTLTSSGTHTYTLSSLTDPAGQSVAFGTVWAVIVQVPTPVTGQYLTVGNAGTHPVALWMDSATHTFQVRNLSVNVSQVDGWAVVSGTTDQLLITNSGSSTLAYNIVVLGQ